MEEVEQEVDIRIINSKVTWVRYGECMVLVRGQSCSCRLRCSLHGSVIISVRASGITGPISQPPSSSSDIAVCQLSFLIMLDIIPPEVLAHIALHLTLPTLAPPISLLQTSKSISRTLIPSSNSRLYARIFRANFDTSAAERRVKGEINSGDLVCELKKRVGALGRLSRMIEKSDVGGVSEEDLWVIYVMLTENGKFFDAWGTKALENIDI
jgi:hypothetical protein